MRVRDRTVVEQRCQGGTGQRRRSIFHLSCSFALLHSHPQLAPRVLRRDGGAVGVASVERVGSTTMASPTERPCNQKKTLPLRLLRLCLCLGQEKSSVAEAAAPAASYLQPLEGSAFLHTSHHQVEGEEEQQQKEEQSRQDARPCAAITRRRKHLNVFMWRLLSPRHLASQATTKMFPLLS